MSAERYANLQYEDELPDDMTDAEYDVWYRASRVVDGVRMGPVFRRSETVWREHAWVAALFLVAFCVLAVLLFIGAALYGWLK